MSEYFDRVQGSAAVADLQNLGTKVGDLRKRCWTHQAMVDLLERLMVVNANVLTRLTLSDCSLITLTTLNELESHSRQLSNLVDQLDPLPLDGQPNIAHMNEAADQLLRSASAMPAVQHRTLADDMHSAAEQFRREAESASGSMRKEYDEVKIQLDSVRSELQNFSEQSSGILQQTQEMVNQQTAQSQADLNSLQSRVQQAISTLENEVSTSQRTFGEAQANREQEFKAAQERRDQDYHERLDSTVAEIENFRDQASSMLEEVAGASMAEHYAKQRDKQNQTADRWRIIGVTALFLLVAAATGLYFDLRTTGGELSVAALLARSSVPASLLILATYALRQSGHHRQREEDVSRVSNELMLLWPFMNRLPDEERKSLMLGITPLYFKGGLSNHDAGDKVGWADKLVDRVSRRNST